MEAKDSVDLRKCPMVVVCRLAKSKDSSVKEWQVSEKRKVSSVGVLCTAETLVKFWGSKHLCYITSTAATTTLKLSESMLPDHARRGVISPQGVPHVVKRYLRWYKTWICRLIRTTWSEMFVPCY